MKVIVVTGTPCTGKTTIAKVLAKKLKWKYLDVNKIIKKYKLIESYDKLRKTNEVSIKKLNKALLKEIKSNSIIDSHLSHYLPKKSVTLCIVLKCSLKDLKKRLIKRKYPEIKIKENLEAEAFETSLVESSKHKNVLVFDTSKEGKTSILKIILKHI